MMGRDKTTQILYYYKTRNDRLKYIVLDYR